MITSKLILTILAIIGSVFASNGFWDWLKTRRKKMTPYERITIAMGRDRLNVLSKKYIKENGIPEDEYESFVELGESYLDAGGNSKVRKLYEEAVNLPKKWDL